MTTSLDELRRLAADAGASDALVRNLLAALQGISGLESIFLARVDRRQDRFELAYTHNAESGRYPIAEGLVIPWSESVCKHALESGTAETGTARDRWPELEIVEDLNITTYAIEPVRDSAGEVIGTLCAVSDRRRPVTAHTRQAMKLIAQLVAPGMGGSVTATAAGDMDQLTAQAARDNMTGLPTRAALARELAKVLAAGERACLAMVDLAGLDAIDAHNGHWAADQFLYAVSQRLAGATAAEPGAYIARYGDREFAVMIRLPASAGSDVGAADEAHLIERLRTRLAAATRGQYEVAWVLVGYDGAVVTPVCSHPGEDAVALLWRADETMRSAEPKAPFR